MAEHHHHPGHCHDFAEANKEHFNKDSDTYDDIPMVKEVTEKEGKYILSHGWTFNPESTTVLNFACGTGLLETTLIAHCKYIQGVDISQGMVGQYNKRAETLGATSKMSAIAYELKGLPEELEGRKFDVVLCTLAYHHFESTEEITRILAYFLKPGGVLLVTDGVSSDAMPNIEEDYEAIVSTQDGLHRGGYEENLHGFKEWKLFLAKGVKPLYVNVWDDGDKTSSIRRQMQLELISVTFHVILFEPYEAKG
ncbi:S-adenosyl-L-methionine-dependent methyltransferase [Armillaria luteobubalina]|uniref:S-adenosyl-L-methionine-dependent methyltransferase n=1 Tax=Armillaria luteobubalina TaxID=153913 RepID=A0AA39QL40_9AGAR|nr:S-adenosyl-L-methionine-dependent methyltransferase [Armillaria luteobubalina]